VTDRDARTCLSNLEFVVTHIITRPLQKPVAQNTERISSKIAGAEFIGPFSFSLICPCGSYVNCVPIVIEGAK
jgi:hypothetical protein